MFRPLTLLTLSAALFLSVSAPALAKSNSEFAMGMEAGCRGLRDCPSWLTRNFAGAKFGIRRSSKSLGSLASNQSIKKETDDSGSDQSSPDTGSSDTLVTNHDNGHGNDPDHVDESNPGDSSNNQNGGSGARDEAHDDNGHANDGSHADHDDNGHGNDAGGVDSSNPGSGGEGGNGNSGGNSDSVGGDDDNGHGNDTGGVDSSNPGNGGSGGNGNDGNSGRGRNK